MTARHPGRASVFKGVFRGRGIHLIAGKHFYGWYTLVIYNFISDIGCQYSRSIYTARFIVWQPRRAADTSTNWRQSLFCCCTASMEQATDGAETDAIDGLVSSWSEQISVSFCRRAPRYGMILWCALGLLVARGRNTSASVTVTVGSLLVRLVTTNVIHLRRR